MFIYDRAGKDTCQYFTRFFRNLLILYFMESREVDETDYYWHNESRLNRDLGIGTGFVVLNEFDILVFICF
jgi:hypothetical protein